MKIDKSFLIEHILKSKDNAYVLDLYKIYELCSRATNNIFKHKDILDALEDKIYTINGKVLSQKERVTLELKKIIKEYSKCDVEKVKADVAGELNALIIFMDNNESNNKRYYEKLKQKISIIEAKLHIPINFLYGASVSFLNIYESEYINGKLLFNDDKILDLINNDITLIKDSEYKYYKNNNDIYNKFYKQDFNDINNKAKEGK